MTPPVTAVFCHWSCFGRASQIIFCPINFPLTAERTGTWICITTGQKLGGDEERRKNFCVCVGSSGQWCSVELSDLNTACKPVMKIDCWCWFYAKLSWNSLGCRTSVSIFPITGGIFQHFIRPFTGHGFSNIFEASSAFKICHLVNRIWRENGQHPAGKCKTTSKFHRACIL